MGTITDFIDKNYLHYNAGTVGDAARAYKAHLEAGHKMMITLAGAMSTAELGISLAEMIRQEKVHAISCTGANLEEDLFNLVAHDHYVRIPNWRDLTPEQEQELLDRHLNRVTDTCIPEHEAMRHIAGLMLEVWEEASKNGEHRLPHEHMYALLDKHYDKLQKQIDPQNSWLIAAWQKRLPIFVPGWEDSTLANMFVAFTIEGNLDIDCVKGGLHYMKALIPWYLENTKGDKGVGFFQIGGGIAGDFPICVVPLIGQDLREDAKYWNYFCQISDAVTSYGGYSGAVPNEKITWGKLAVETPKFVIESDATIVAPLIFNYVLGN